MITLLTVLLASDPSASLTPRAFFGDEAFDRSRECIGAPFLTRPQPLLTEFQGTWYLKHFRAAGEPPLDGRAAGATWRFTWLRSFHAPVVVRIEQTAPGKMRLIAKRLSGHGGYDPGEVAETLERWLTPAEEGKVRAAVSPAQAVDERDCSLTMDGARWIFESTADGRRRMVHATTPDDGPLRDVGTVFLDLTGWTLEPRY